MENGPEKQKNCISLIGTKIIYKGALFILVGINCILTYVHDVPMRCLQDISLGHKHMPMCYYTYTSLILLLRYVFD